MNTNTPWIEHSTNYSGQYGGVEQWDQSKPRSGARRTYRTNLGGQHSADAAGRVAAGC